MTEGKLAEILNDRYFNAGEGKVALSIHLFGIDHAIELQGHNIEQICALANIPKSYGTEIRKGMRLAEYVVRRTNN